MDTRHPAQKAQDDLTLAQARFDRQAKLIAEGSIPAPADITKTPAYLKLKDAQRAAAFFSGEAAMDEMAGISTSLTEGLRTLQVEGFQLHATPAPCDLIAQALLTHHLGAVA